LSKAILNKRKLKINIGCGTDYKKGWINIDNNSDHNIERLDLNWDMRSPLPFKANSVDFVYNEHFFEHLTVADGQAVMKDIMRVLKLGGVMRIAMPDLKEAVGAYYNKGWKNREFMKNFGLEFVQTKAEMLNMNFSWWGHKWLYDWEELKRRLKEAGYKNIKKCQRSKSYHPDLVNLETREESNLIAEVTK
jgi:predicted SAM-dependent methyltransferase